MREISLNIDERDFANIVAGQLFEQCPNRKVRNAETIIERAIELMRKDSNKFLGHYRLTIDEIDLYDYLKNLFNSIPEFVELNLSQNEYDKKIEVDDPSRPKFSFYFGWEFKDEEETWRDDFLDLDAFIQNIYCTFVKCNNNMKSCFSCLHNNLNEGTPQDTDVCNHCKFNETNTDNYVSNIHRAIDCSKMCKSTCVYGRKICCEKCPVKKCDCVCDSTPDVCGRVLDSINIKCK